VAPPAGAETAGAPAAGDGQTKRGPKDGPEGDEIGVEIGRIRRSGSRLELRGEFDLGVLGELRDALGALHNSGPTLVDLSGVTFMDSSCAGELAAWRRLSPGLLSLATPSWQARASFSACGLSGGLEPPPRTGPPGAVEGCGIPPMGCGSGRGETNGGSRLVRASAGEARQASSPCDGDVPNDPAPRPLPSAGEPLLGHDPASDRGNPGGPICRDDEDAGPPRSAGR